MKRAVTVLLTAVLLCTLFFGCVRAGQSAAGTDSVQIWRVHEGAQPGELLQAETLSLSGGSRAKVEDVLALFQRRTRADGLRCALPDGVEVLSWTGESGLVTLTLSDAFLTVAAMDQTAAVFAAVLTLCQLDEVDAVSIEVGGETLFHALDAEDALLQDTDSDPYTRRLRLYFASSDGQWLESEYHSLSLDDDSALERYVMEELLRGPNDPALRSAIPEGTELLSCRTDGGVCTVDLSAAFVENKPETALGERLAVWSIVNSLTALADVESVQLLCQGEAVDSYVYRSLAEPLGFLKAAVGPPATAKGELGAALYLALPGLDSFAAMPILLDSSSFEQDETDALLAALADVDEPGLPKLFFGSGTILSSSVVGRIRVVDVAESFFASLQPDEREAAAKSLAATVLGLGLERGVRITMNGEDAVFEGVSYAGPWTEIDINIVE